MSHLLLFLGGVLCVGLMAMPACGVSIQELPPGLAPAGPDEAGDNDHATTEEFVKDFLSVGDHQWQQRRSQVRVPLEAVARPLVISEVNDTGLSQEEQQELMMRHGKNFLVENSTAIFKMPQPESLESIPPSFPEPQTFTAIAFSLVALGIYLSRKICRVQTRHWFVSPMKC
jgi:hypothetical protein